MRINKFISETGFCSRREADKLVEDGRVTINGVKAQLGSQAEPGDDVRVNGKRVGASRRHVYIALNKPVGITSTTEQQVKGNIVDFVGHRERIFPIGRLDKDSEGLILMTNDGDIVNRILRAEGRHEKEYIVTVDKTVTPMFLKGMSEGVRILGAMTLPCKLTRVAERVFKIILTEGKNRQIRRMCEAFGFRVVRLRRVRIMNIHLGDLAIGRWRDLQRDELDELFETLNYHPGTE
ncbi:23S rRNA pseudouridine(2604) synthase RluF (plasmid) [Paenibacillus cellulosilyticus]|uniref:23S rRNA pseudouridine(2604) synthase RluF n=1 Tax=Paenibacillus cellulosilyticus TaxID=375489 RepID=UPI000D71A476|nr:23S rRNA pseudouridine(2604) synthase RluF [Paenibacillus cellulosilyticus]QKS48570.1 23S rRNA pseudouridine(2604) synthase RluF [Paenibacillus cellulosilyticus]